MPARTDGRAGLTYVVWELTLRCDQACHHCGSRAGKPREDELSTEEALDVVRQLKALGVAEITLIGGEAYLRDDWTDIARAIVAQGMKCTMTTGGRGFTEARARAAFDAGISGIAVSIDGLRATHDELRGLSGSFDSALAALRAVREAGLRPATNTQISRRNVAELEALYELFLAEGAQGWQVQLTVPMGRAADRPDWLLQPYDLLELYPRLARLFERGARDGMLLWPANNIGYFGPHEAILRGRGRDRGEHFTGCIAGDRALGIEADGTIKGCPSLPTNSYGGGNVRDETIREIVASSRELRFTRDRDVTSLWGFCRGCYYASTCLGGCTWTAHVFFGKPGNNPYCHHRALSYDEQGLRERLVPRERAPGVPFDHGRFEVVLEDRCGADAMPEGGAGRTRLPLLGM